MCWTKLKTIVHS